MKKPTQLLLDLALEFSTAKENLAAVNAFSHYLEARFGSSEITYHHLEKDSEEAKKWVEGVSFHQNETSYTFLLSLQIPIVFEALRCNLNPPSQEEQETIRKISQFFKEKLDTIAELKGLTYTDDLTGLYNQRYMELILDREFSLVKRNGAEFSVLFLDLDHFKNVNDTHGHLIGSRLLYEVGQEIKKALRESDITFRYGGDEFVIVLSMTGLEPAVAVAERIRVQIEKKRFLVKDGLEIRLTASIGVASVPLHASSKEQILKVADEALYGVKKAVRNRVIAATTKAEVK